MKLPSVYEPQQYEADIYALWEKKGALQPQNRGGEGYFSMVVPPPNANANLHIGQGLTLNIEDIIVRYNRLKGKETLFVPGADHAGFETWVVYEKKLNQEGKSRFDFTREELYKQVWDFVQLNKHNFEAQMRALGASVDWSRYTFTLDSKVVTTAYKTFQKMWHDDLIYRAKRIVNFCTFHGTSFSDIEVVYEEEKSKLWHIAYPLTEGGGEVVVATARPETMLGDTAVAVHPDDPRYKNLVGKTAKLPLVNREVPIVGDEMVDPKFGSGAVKVTPGHDPNDFELAQRHNLPIIELISTEGKIIDEAAGRFKGLTVSEARQAVVKELEAGGHLRSVEDYTHSIGKCYKCGTVIEPLLLEQWFVRMKPLASRAIEVLKNKEITFYPDSKRTQLIRYLEGLRDWNISRQIAWGIPIPAFQNTDDPKDWIFDSRVTEETIEVNGKKYRRDPDVFDTWFSSSSWPYVTLNFPDGEDFKKFYPLSLMETAGEILYPWVSRMIMMGFYMTGKIPFKEVYIHGLVLAEGGAKMSKSLGNVVDPMEIIGEFGADAFRMGIIAGRAPAVNRGYDPRRVEEARNFTNKLWNIARFIESKIGDSQQVTKDPKAQSLADHWILSRLHQTVSEVSQALDNYRLSEAYEMLYQFVWHDLADWYIEASKIQPNEAMLAYVLEQTLKLAHPFAPFVTETIWQTLAWEQGSLLATQAWPKVAAGDPAQGQQFDELRSIISEIRWLRGMSDAKPERLYYKDPQAGRHAELIVKLAGLKEVKQAPQNYSGGLRLTSVSSDWWLDIDPETTVNKLRAKLEEYQKTVDSLKARLDNQDYLAKAPKELVDETKKQLSEAQLKLNHLDNVLSALKS